MKLNEDDALLMVAQAIRFEQTRHEEFVDHLLEQGHPETAWAAQFLVRLEVETATMEDLPIAMVELADLVVALLNFAHIKEAEFRAFLQEREQSHHLPLVSQLDDMRRHFSSVHHKLVDSED